MQSRHELIRELSEDLDPSPRMRGPFQLALLWLICAWAIVLTATLAVQPMRPGFASQLVGSPRFVAETLLGITAGALAIRSAFAAGIPGWPGKRRWITMSLGLLSLSVSVYIYGLVDPTLEPSMLGKRSLCFAEVLIYGLPILTGGLLLLRRLAPLERGRIGFLTGAAAGAIPGVLMQLACMYIPSHILMFHIAPALAVAIVGSLLGPLVLRRI